MIDVSDGLTSELFHLCKQSELGASIFEDKLPIYEKTYETAVRELKEETGINANDHHLINWNMSNEFEIFKHWRGRYAPGVTHNVEHAFGLLVPGRVPIKISPREHLQFDWVRIEEAMDRVFSWTNVDALRFLLKNHASSR